MCNTRDRVEDFGAYQKAKSVGFACTFAVDGRFLGRFRNPKTRFSWGRNRKTDDKKYRLNLGQHGGRLRSRIWTRISSILSILPWLSS